MAIEMSIEQKMIYVRRVLELGADVELNFHNIRDQEEAQQVASELSELTSLSYEKRSGNNCDWFKFSNYGDRCDRFEIAIFYDGNEKEVTV